MVFEYALLEQVFGWFCLKERGRARWRESCKNWNEKNRKRRVGERIDVFVFMHDMVFNMALLCSCASNWEWDGWCMGAMRSILGYLPIDMRRGNAEMEGSISWASAYRLCLGVYFSIIGCVFEYCIYFWILGQTGMGKRRDHLLMKERICIRGFNTVQQHMVNSQIGVATVWVMAW